MDKRALLAIALCTLVFIVYMQVLQRMYPPVNAPQDPGASPQQPSPTVPSNGAQKGPENGARAPETAKPEFTLIPAEIKEYSITTKNRFKAVFTTRGGALKELVSEHFYKDPKRREYLPYLKPGKNGEAHFQLSVEPSAVDLTAVPWEAHVDGTTARFVQRTPEGLEITKTFTLEPDKDTFKFSFDVKPLKPQTVTLRLTAFSGIEHDSSYRAAQYLNGFTGTNNAQGTSIQYFYLGKETASVPNTQISWTGIKNRYFTAVMAPQGTEFIESFEFVPMTNPDAPSDPNQGNLLNRVVFKKHAFQDRPFVFEAGIYAGEIKAGKLQAVGHGLESLMDYSGFDFIGASILWMMNLCHSVIGNFGIAIILTTLLVRVIMFPISKKSTVSSFKMQQLQPKLAALKEKYKGDSQKFAKEQMKLFKESGVSPFTGCLGLLVQFPIFIGMYSVFDISVDLRQSHFFLWINDLSQPDRLGTLPMSILGSRDLNILPLIMLAATVWQMIGMPKSPDPNMAVQRKIMMFMMPAMLVLFCYGQASGLSLYFTINAAASMVEQKLIKKYFLPESVH